MSLTRRDILAQFLGAPLALAACRREPPRVDASFAGASADSGHRSRQPQPIPSVPPERVVRKRVVIVGGGPSGLSAAWAMRRAGFKDVVVLEAEPRPGGTSASGRSDVTAYPFGAHYLPVPDRTNPALLSLLDEMGALDGVDEHGLPRGAEHMLVREPDERLFMHGYWHQGLLPRAGMSADDARQIGAFQQEVHRLSQLTDGRGRRAFSLPLRFSSDDAELTALDRISMAQWMDQHGFTSKRLRWMVEYACRDDHGTLLPDTSAWVALFYFCARHRPETGESAPFLTWPEGNGRLVTHLAKPLGAALQLNTVVLDVAPTESGVEITALDAQGPVKYVAERVVAAVPKPFLRHVVKPWRENPPSHLQAFRYGSWLTANLHLRSRPVTRGFEVAWDNVIYDSPSLGYIVATHQRGPDLGPTVWTWYLPVTDPDVIKARKWLLALSAQEAADVALQDLGRAHADLVERVERVEVFRHGHAMVRPDVGFMWGADRRKAQEPLGRIHFAHCDLSGLPLFEEAFDQGIRAAEEVMAALQIPFATLR
ncbi:MAG: FAD-dependent oxidoreductase [Myxococcota bacterium]